MRLPVIALLATSALLAACAGSSEAVAESEGAATAGTSAEPAIDTSEYFTFDGIFTPESSAALFEELTVKEGHGVKQAGLLENSVLNNGIRCQRDRCIFLVGVFARGDTPLGGQAQAGGVTVFQSGDFIVRGLGARAIFEALPSDTESQLGNNLSRSAANVSCVLKVDLAPDTLPENFDDIEVKPPAALCSIKGLQAVVRPIRASHTEAEAKTLAKRFTN